MLWPKSMVLFSRREPKYSVNTFLFKKFYLHDATFFDFIKTYSHLTRNLENISKNMIYLYFLFMRLNFSDNLFPKVNFIRFFWKKYIHTVVISRILCCKLLYSSKQIYSSRLDPQNTSVHQPQKIASSCSKQPKWRKSHRFFNVLNHIRTLTHKLLGIW